MKVKSYYKESEYKIIFREYYFTLVNFASFYIRDNAAAEDIVQEIFVDLWNNRVVLKDELALRVYLYRAVQHRSLNYLRDQKIKSRHEISIAESLYPDEVSALNDLIKKEVYRQLFLIVEELPAQCRKICEMTLEGKKPSEIAKELNLSVETVKKQKKIALKRLRDQLGDFSPVVIWLSVFLD